MGNRCCAEARGAGPIAVVGTSSSGCSTIALRLARDRCVPRVPSREGDEEAVCVERWAARPLPSTGVSEAPSVKHRGRTHRVVDLGPSLAPPPRLPLPVDPGRVSLSASATGPSLVAQLDEYAPSGGAGPSSSSIAGSADRALAMKVLSSAAGVIVVLDASRTLEDQDALSLLRVVADTEGGAERPLVVLLTKYDLASTETLPSFLTPRVIESIPSVARRLAPWACHPCVATHRYLSLRGTLSFLFDPKQRVEHVRPHYLVPRAAAVARGSPSDLQQDSLSMALQHKGQHSQLAEEPVEYEGGLQPLARHTSMMPVLAR